MGLSLKSIGKKIEGLGAQINPFDNGATYNTVLQNRPPPPAPSVAQQIIHAPIVGPVVRNTVQPLISADRFLSNNLGLTDLAKAAGFFPATQNQRLQSAKNLGQGAVRYPIQAGQQLANTGLQASNTIPNDVAGTAPSLQHQYKAVKKTNGTLPAVLQTGFQGTMDVAPLLGAVKPAVKLAGETPKNEIGAVGKNVKPPALPGEVVPSKGLNVNQRTAKAGEGTLKTTDGKSITQEEFNKLISSKPGVKITNRDKVIANSTGETPKVVAAGRQAGADRLQADTAALNHLQNGGTRDEAASIYQQASGRTANQSQYRVQQLAKSAKTSLNVSPKVPNPLSGQFHLPSAKPGEFQRAPQNQITVTNNIDRAMQGARNAYKNLSLKQRQQVPDVVEGTVKTSDSAVQAAAKASQNLTDTIHAVGEPYGTTPHISNYFPRYFADHAEQSPEVQMAQEEAALANHGQVPLEDSGNYAGFHNKSRIFKTRQEAQAANFKLLNEDPLADLERLSAGAKINIGNQAFIKAAREADQAINPQELSKPGNTKTIDLPGNQGVRVSEQGYKALKGYSTRPKPGVFKKTLQGVNKSVVRTIVANPIFHGANQEFNAIFQSAWRMPGNKVANMANFIKNHGDVSEADVSNFYKDGGFSPTYGKNDYGFIAKGVQKLGGDPAKVEASPRAMAAIEQNIRTSLYKAGKSRGMSPDEINGLINKTLGGPDIINDFSSTYGLFQHYLQTNLKLLGDVGVKAAKGNLAPLAGLSLGAAAWFAATKGWQQATGNKNATVRAPGVLGTGIQALKSVNQLRHGQVPSIVKTHTNPLIVTGLEQAVNRDFTKPVVGALSQNNNLDGQRLKIAGTNLVGPGLTIQNVAGAKTSLPEAALGYTTGLYTPHAKGYQAAPNIPVLNKKGAQPGTGLDQQKQYFNAHDTLLKTVYGDKRASDAVNSFLDRNRTASGQSIELNPRESISAAVGLAGNDKALSAVQKFEKNSNTSHPPMWDLSKADLQHYLDYKGSRKTDDEKAVMVDTGQGFNNGEGLKEFNQRNNDWYNNQPKHPGQPPVAAPGTPVYPNFPTNTQSALDQYGKMTDPTAKGQFLDAHPEIIQAFNDIAKYNNQLGVAQGGVAKKNYPEANPQLQSFMDTYNGASKAQRKAIRSANPASYQKMIAYFDSVDLYNINKTGGKDQYVGEPDQTSGQNKAISSLARDIYQSPNGSYSIVPAGWMQGLSNSSSGGSSSSSKKHFTSARSLRGVKLNVGYDKIRSKKVSLKGKGTGKGKLIAGGKGRPTVSIKKSLI